VGFSLLGLLLGFLAFNGWGMVMGLTGGIPPFLWWSPYFVITAGVAYWAKEKWIDETGLTWYGKYGEGPGNFLLWAFVVGSCFSLVQVVIPSHWPGIGLHNVPQDSWRSFILSGGECSDDPNLNFLCTQEACKAVQEGNAAYAEEQNICGEQKVKDSTIPCATAPPLTGLDVIMDSCNKYCGCKDEFNPIAQTGADYDNFKCAKNGSCRLPRVHFMELREASLRDRAPCCHRNFHVLPGAMAVPEGCEAVERVFPPPLDRTNSGALDLSESACDLVP